MADANTSTANAGTQTLNLDYASGYKDGLNAGFDAGLAAQYHQGPSNARKLAAWVVLAAGLAGAGGVLLGSQRKTMNLGTTIIIGSSIATAFVTSIQLLVAGGRRF